MNLILPIFGVALVTALFLRNNRLRWTMIAIVVVLAVARFYLRGK